MTLFSFLSNPIGICCIKNEHLIFLLHVGAITLLKEDFLLAKIFYYLAEIEWEENFALYDFELCWFKSLKFYWTI